MSISRKKEPVIFNYNMNDTSLNRVSEVKDLGVTYNSLLSYATHIENTVKSANRTLGFIIRQTSLFSNLETIKLLYNTLVLSKLDFASIIWEQQPQMYLDTLEKVQNKFLRYLYYKKYHRWPDYNEIRTQTLRQEFEIPSLIIRRKQAMMKFLFNLMNNQISSSTLLSLVPINVPPKRTRCPLMFNLQTTSTHSPFYAILRLANNINMMRNLDWTMSYQEYRKTLLHYFEIMSI